GNHCGVAPRMRHAFMSSSRRASAAAPSDEKPALRSHQPLGAAESGSPANTVRTRTRAPDRAALAIAAPSENTASSRCGETTTTSPDRTCGPEPWVDRSRRTPHHPDKQGGESASYSSRLAG